MNGSGGFGRVLLFAFGVLAPVAWGTLTFFELHEKAAEAALALTVVGAATGMLLQWAWLSQMEKLARQLESRLSRESSGLGYGPGAHGPGAYGPGANAPAAATSGKQVSPAMGKGGGAAPAAPVRTGSSPAAPPAPAPLAAAPSPGVCAGGSSWQEPKNAGYGSPVDRRSESGPPPFSAPPGASEGGSGFGGNWIEPAPSRPETARGRRLEPATLAAVWAELLADGIFDSRSLSAALRSAGVEAEVLPPDNFVGLGNPLLVVAEPGKKERGFLLPDFTRQPKAFVKWFDLGPEASAPSARIQRLSRPAELKRGGAGYELAARGLIE